MSIGAGIVIFVIGAVLAFAVDGSLGGGYIDLNTIGFIMMAAGVVVFLLGLVFTFKKRKNVSTSRDVIDPATGERVTQRETLRNDQPLA
jgi:hypothetical protein